MKICFLTVVIGTLLAGTTFAAPKAPATPVAAAAPVVSAAELFGTPLVSDFQLKLPGGELQVTAACKCEEWTVIKYKPCLQYSEDGTRCVKHGPEEKRKCCSRTSCGESEC